MPQPFARARALSAALIAALLAACRPAPPPSVDDLAFPVLVLWESSGIVRHDDPQDLGVMSTQRVVNAHTAPYLIDAKLDIYRLEALSSTHGGLWLMANPVGRTDVTFRLARVAQGDVEQARRLVLEREYALRSDEGARERVARAEDMAAIRAAIGK